MPTYEYQCKKCGHLFETLQKMTEEPVKACPVCKGNVKRLIGTGVGLIFKGSGFYATDYKRNANGRKGKTVRPDKEKKSDSSSKQETTKKSDD